MSIKYTPEFNRKIRQILKNYNRKVARLESKSPASKRIPPHITARSLKSTYTSRTDLERKLKLLESFSQEKMQKTTMISSDNVRTNQYEYESFKLNQKVAKQRIQRLLNINRKKDKAEGRLLPSQRTRSLHAQLKTIEKASKPNFSYQSYLASRNIADRYSDRREESDKRFYENFFDMLWADQIYAEIDPDLIQDIHDQIEQLTPEQLLEMYNNEPDISRLVEDYHKYTDTQGYAITDEEVIRARIRAENLHDILPALVEKYKKF